MRRKTSVAAPTRPSTLAGIHAEMRAQADPERARILQRFFRTGPGEYGEGDRFLGLTVPQTRKLTREHRHAPVAVRLSLLRSPIHEERLLALLLMVQAYGKSDTAGRAALAKEYLAN
ncbi:MAG TPA: DNA alkylation repair protein, partial [Fibrobacteria bacterium]|nr:DNA alkylation repair protein [Fibrobacteria bacterium]